jgi:hypothetical protein
MIKSALGKVMWVGRATVFVVGLAVILAMVVGLASTALAANGANFIIGNGLADTVKNIATLPTKLTMNGTATGPALQLTQKSTSTGAQGLGVTVPSGKVPITVNSTAGKATNLNADKLDGKDFAAFNAQELLDAFGPLPLQSTYTSQGGTLIISASGSGYRSLAFAQNTGDIGMRVLVDGVTRDTIGMTVNQRDIRHSFVAEDVVVKGLPAGTHTIRLEALYETACNTANESPFNYCTTTNGDDRFNVTVVEIPT